MLPVRHHILNGDSLNSQFPDSIEGNIIVARECMIVGSTIGNTFEEIMESRFIFMKDAYQITKKEHLEKTVSEFNKICKLKETDEVFLWFEHDLFCQANLWFVLYLIQLYTPLRSVQLITPPNKHRYGFYALSNEELKLAFTNRIEMNFSAIKKFSELWEHYQSGNNKKLMTTSKSLVRDFPFVIKAIDVHLQRNLDSTELGRPERELIRLSNELNTTEFKVIFQHFKQKEAIYGFGDTQVRSMFDKLMKDGLIKAGK